MNAIFLIAAAVIAFAFGYRFYAKLLALEIFRLDKNYSTPTAAAGAARESVPLNRHLLLGHHVATVAGIAVCAGPIVVVAWGWIPAFLWLTIGTAVGAGTYAM